MRLSKQGLICLNSNSNIENLAITLSNKLFENNQEEDELAKSLKEIEVCYKKNKDRLEKDLNKMEYKITQIRDTRERISLKHIKSLDIVEKFVHKVMPNNLTDSQIKINKSKIEQSKLRVGNESERDGAQMSSIEQIRNDLENDDIFILGYRGGQTQNQFETEYNSQAEEEKQDERIKEDDEESVLSDADKIQELKSEKKRILESLDENKVADRVLIDQLYDMEILKVKKSLRKERNSAAQSHRNQLHDLEQRNNLVNSEISKGYKSQSLKNSQKINQTEILRHNQMKAQNLVKSSDKQLALLIKIIRMNKHPRFVKLIKSEQQPQKNVHIVKPLALNPQVLVFNNSNEKSNPQMQIQNIKQQKPFVLNKKFVNLLKKNIQKQENEGQGHSSFINNSGPNNFNTNTSNNSNSFSYRQSNNPNSGVQSIIIPKFNQVVISQMSPKQ
ncbi:UNKNOWN [Stylonychia lemnae]|uniref:Uncharacterized protein n=1 Tax=Stylonychia lemnae TaxID=5949 RepID=A0A077ZUG7_STYLE|nr:UNKNOWN [Stylonychia lemnae]|eukprot:CDW72116.1 UNKNOWN [Stylonychia lemnae]